MRHGNAGKQQASDITFLIRYRGIRTNMLFPHDFCYPDIGFALYKDNFSQFLGKLCACGAFPILLDCGIGPGVPQENRKFAVHPFLQGIQDLRFILHPDMFQLVGKDVGAIGTVVFQNGYDKAVKHKDAKAGHSGNAEGQKGNDKAAYLSAQMLCFSLFLIHCSSLQFAFILVIVWD